MTRFPLPRSLKAPRKPSWGFFSVFLIFRFCVASCYYSVRKDCSKDYTYGSNSNTAFFYQEHNNNSHDPHNSNSCHICPTQIFHLFSLLVFQCCLKYATAYQKGKQTLNPRSEGLTFKELHILAEIVYSVNGIDYIWLIKAVFIRKYPLN